MTHTASTHAAVVSIESFALSSELLSVLGERGAVLTQLHAYHLPMPPLFVIPLGILEAIAEHNAFSKLLDKLLHVDWENQVEVTQMGQDIRDAIQHFKIPSSIAHELSKGYATFLENSYVEISASLFYDATEETFTAHHISGEANIWESLLKVWSKLYAKEFLHARAGEWHLHHLIPAIFLLQHEVEAEVSGRAINLDPHRKHDVTVFSHWGVSDETAEEKETLDVFKIDTVNGKILEKKIAYKSSYAELNLDYVRMKSLSEQKRNTESLTLEKLLLVGDTFEHVRKKVAPHVEIEWSLREKSVFVTHLHFPQKKDDTVSIPSDVPRVAPKKIFISVTIPSKANEEVVAHCDGIGLLRSENLLTPLGVHPMHIIEQGKSDIIKLIITSALKTYHEKAAGKLLLYRTHDATTTELAHLLHGNDYETREENPFIGYRGGIRILRSSTLFDVELEAVKEAWQQTKHPLGIMVPFVRTTSEWALIKKHMEKKLMGMPIEMWMQCDTPENVFQIGAYANAGAENFSLNLRNIHALLHGISPDDTDIFRLYLSDRSLLYLVLKFVSTQLHHTKSRVLLQTEEYSADVFELCSQLGFWGVTVKPRDVSKIWSTAYAHN